MFNIFDLTKAEQEFHTVYGMTLAQWATIEQRLFFWFWYITKLPEPMARAIFYSAKNFNGRADMLSGSIECSTLPPKARAVAEECVRRSRAYQAFRNAITHGEPYWDMVPDSPTCSQTILLQGREEASQSSPRVTKSDLLWGCSHLRELSRLITDGRRASQLQDDASLDKCLEQLQKLRGAIYPIPQDQNR
jgi:hypothetical protein